MYVRRCLAAAGGNAIAQACTLLMRQPQEQMAERLPSRDDTKNVLQRIDDLLEEVEQLRQTDGSRQRRNGRPIE